MTKTSKVNLFLTKPTGWHATGTSTKPLISSLPLYKSRRGKYFHRVRYGNGHWVNGELSHTSIGFWCGNGGFLGEKGALYQSVPDGGVLCATCEGRAIGAGINGLPVINGRLVKFSPRRDMADEA